MGSVDLDKDHLPLSACHQAWQNLYQDAKQAPNLSMLFDQQDQSGSVPRGEAFQCTACDILMDFSKQKLTKKTLTDLLHLAKVSHLKRKTNKHHKPNINQVLKQKRN